MQKLIRLFIPFALILFSNAIAGAAEPGTFLIGVGVLSHGYNRVVQDPSGSPGKLGTLYENLLFETQISLSDSWLFSPEIFWMPDFLLPNQGVGGNEKTSFLILGLPLTYDLGSSFDVSGGLALVNYEIKGAGGTTVLNNGTGSNTFALPGGTTHSTTVGILLGAGYDYKPVRFSFDVLTEGLLSNSKRTFSFLLAVSYQAFNL